LIRGTTYLFIYLFIYSIHQSTQFPFVAARSVDNGETSAPFSGRCQPVDDVRWRQTERRLIDHQAELVVDLLNDWKPVQLSQSRRHVIARPKV